MIPFFSQLVERYQGDLERRMGPSLLPSHRQALAGDRPALAVRKRQRLMVLAMFWTVTQHQESPIPAAMQLPALPATEKAQQWT